MRGLVVGSAAIYGACAGVALLAAVMMVRRGMIAFAYRAAVALFLLIALICAVNVAQLAFERPPAWVTPTGGGAVAAAFAVGWLYVRDLTSDVPRPLVPGDLIHFAVPFGFLADVLRAASQAPGDGGPVMGSAGWEPILKALWLGQITLYTAMIALTLARLPRRLRKAFSDTDGRDLLGLRVIVVLLIVHWAMATAFNVDAREGSEIAFSVVSFLFTFVFAGWAIRQAPVFQAKADRPERVVVADNPAPTEKYARSLLDDERLDRIAVRIETAFVGERMHLDANLTLAKLSQRTGVGESQLSQTFTRKLRTSFFEHVNRHRVEEAKRLLETSDASVADIAVEAGFNSRSAFYRAFREVTGHAPAAWRDVTTDRATGP